MQPQHCASVSYQNDVDNALYCYQDNVQCYLCKRQFRNYCGNLFCSEHDTGGGFLYTQLIGHAYNIPVLRGEIT
jgi:hypothetical protein